MDINTIFSELAKYNMIIKEAESEKKRLETLIKDAMQAAGTDTITGIEHKASISSYEKSSFNAKALETSLPDVYNQFLEIKTIVRFNFR